MTTAAADASRLPPLLTGSRRRLFAGLVLAGLGQAAAAGVTVAVLTRGLQADSTRTEIIAVAVLGVIAVFVGWTRSRERVLAERLGQDYVHELRLGLVRQVLDGRRSGSLGVTLTRASNDLSAVRNWVALGVAPIAVAVPLLLGCTVVLATIHPVVALGVLAPLLVLGVVLLVASRAAYDRSRRVRRERGRLASHLADTLTATAAIRSAGGGYRELKRLDRRSSKVVDAAIERARVIGRIRGTAMAATGVATATVIAASMFAGLAPAGLAAALTVVGLMSAPTQDLGRVVEYRQSFRAARAVLAPALPPVGRSEQRRSAPVAAGEAEQDDAPAEPLPVSFPEVDLVVHNMALDDDPDNPVPPLYARAGDRVVVRGDRARRSAVLETLVGVRKPAGGRVRVAGKDLTAVGFRERRRLFGYAAQGMRLERTTVARAVRYRRPEADGAAVSTVLTAVGLAERVAALEGAQRATLRQGGSPLSRPDVARLLLARAMFGEPPLLVLDHLDADMGDDGRRTLRDVLGSYPGVVVLASDRPDDVLTPTRQWDVGQPVVRS